MANGRGQNNGTTNSSLSCDETQSIFDTDWDNQDQDLLEQNFFITSNDSNQNLNGNDYRPNSGNYDTALYDASTSTGDSQNHCTREDSHPSTNSLDELQDENVPEELQAASASKYRIVDPEHYFQVLQEIFRLHDINQRANCNFNHLIISRSRNNGIMSKVRVTCTRCNFVKWVNLYNDDADAMTLNESVVAATMFTGINFNNVEELFAGIDIPFMTPKAFKELREEQLLAYFEWAALKEMEDAGRQEREYAQAAGHIINGIPYIVVMLDGSWMNRSYRSSRHDSLSGMACIIGQRTGKVLYAGVHNKYCSLCSWYEKRNLQPREHHCFKTWGRDTSSGSMEQHIVVSGFKASIEMHNVMYKTLIADGDSSVYQMILDANPYEGVRVEKIECCNHLLRNFCTKLVELSKTRNLPFLPRGTVGRFRAMIKKSAFNFRKVIRKAVIDRSGQPDLREAEKAKLLQEDIMNMMDHMYGDHQNCARLGVNCDAAEAAKKTNHVPNLKKCGLYNLIKKAVDDLSCHSLSLIRNFTSNSVECFNNVIAKAIGGKRTNHGCRDSYYMRCLAAILMFNSKQGMTKLNQHNELTPFHEIVHLEEKRKAKVIENKKIIEKSGRKKRFVNSSNADYGENCKKPDVDADRFEQLCNALKEKLKTEAENRENIERRTVDQSKSEEWFIYKRERLTASFFGKVCNRRPSTRTCNTVKEILYPKTSKAKLAALEYGNRYESEAREELAKAIGEEIVPCGLFIDETLHYLGASPDGLVADDAIVEIKCPSSCENMELTDVWETKKNIRRIFSKNDLSQMNPNHVYYFQVQGQLHITGRSTCIFAIWTREELHYVYVKKDDNFWSTKMEPKLSRFYNDCLMPEIVDSRLIRLMPLREPAWAAQPPSREQNVPARRIDRVKRKHINDLCHLVGEMEPPRRRARIHSLSGENESDSREISPVPSNNSQDEHQDVDPQDAESQNVRTRRNWEQNISHPDDISPNDEESSDYADNNEEGTASDHLSCFSDYPDSDISFSCTDGEQDNDSENDQQQNERQQINHQRNDHQGNSEILGTEIYGRQLDHEQQKAFNEVLDAMNIDQVENSERVAGRVLSEGESLEDDAINLFINVLTYHLSKKNMSHIITHPIHYFIYPMLLSSIGGLNLDRDHLQIIGDSQSMHWCCLYYFEHKIFIYDSLRTEKDLSRREKLYLQVRYPRSNDIIFPRVTRQPPGSNACGVYAAAFATAAAFGEDPSQINFSQDELLMRNHFYSILRSGELSKFPTVENNA